MKSPLPIAETSTLPDPVKLLAGIDAVRSPTETSTDLTRPLASVATERTEPMARPPRLTIAMSGATSELPSPRAAVAQASSAASKILAAAQDISASAALDASQEQAARDSGWRPR